MTIFTSHGKPVPYPAPDNKTLPQFILDGERPKPYPDVPEYPCFIEEATGRKVYIDELRTRTNLLARVFSHTYGLGETDVVSLCSPNHIDWGNCMWASHRLGCILAPMGPTLTVDEMVHQLNIAKPSLFLVHYETLPVALEAAAKINLPRSRIIVIDLPKTQTDFPSLSNLIDGASSLPPLKEFQLKDGQGRTKIAVLIFSSGTTGIPKAVSISHHNLISFIVQVFTFCRVHDSTLPEKDRKFAAGQVASGVLPLYHIYGLACNFLFIVYSRMTFVVSTKFNFEVFLQSISRYKISHLLIVPPQGVLLAKHPAARKADLSSVKICILAGAPVTADLVQHLLDLMPTVKIGQGYGLSETTAGISFFPPHQQIGTPGSGGQLVSGAIAKIVKPDGSLAGPGEPGELYLQGDQIMIGYYENEQATKDAFVDGWLRTGDEVVIHENGDLFVLDRIKELIKVRGNQVAPAELEGHLLSHPDVADAGVVGVLDDYSGEVPLAFVVLHPHLYSSIKSDPQKQAEVRNRIFKHVSDAKSKYKWLEGGIVFLEAIPKNPSGKILRRVLREQAKSLPRRAREPAAKL